MLLLLFKFCLMSFLLQLPLQPNLYNLPKLQLIYFIQNSLEQMSTHQRTPIQQLKHDQSSQVSQSPYRQTQFTYQLPKIDHAFIVENYRRLRIQQRDQLARLRMPDDIKQKIFNFKEDQDLKHTKPELVIFNHPFRGKMVLTKPEVEKQLERQRKNAELVEEFQGKNQKVPQNFFNDMGLQQEQLQLKKTKMVRQPSQKEQNYPRKPRLTSNQPERKVAQQINKQQQKIQEDKMYFIHKNKDHEETEKEKDKKMQRLMEQKQSKSRGMSNQPDQKSPDQKDRKPRQSKIFKDIPIIGEEPKVVRDIKFDYGTITSQQDVNRPLVKEQNVKKFYRPFGNENEIRQLESKQTKNNRWAQNERQFGSGEGLVKRKGFEQNDPFSNGNEKSISEISAIPSNDKDNDLSEAHSLNKGLFLE